MGDTPLLERVDWALMGTLMLVGLVLRLLWFSGYGLGDDILFRHDMAMLLNQHTVALDNMAYRVTWWFPTAVACRALGLGEAALVLPVTVVSTLGTGLVYAFGRALWGRAGAVVAALLLVATPLDFAWTTMMNLDAFCSVFSAGAMFFALRALAFEDPARRRRAWALAAWSLWLAFHAKVSAVTLLPALAVVCWARRARLDRTVLTFVGTAAVLFGITALTSYVFTGDVLAPYHVEITTQGLAGDVAIKFHRLDANTFWAYPRWLFLPDPYGQLLFGLAPHALVALAALGWVIGLRPSWPIVWWLFFVFVGMQFNIQRVQGVWVAGFRNYRHGHVFVYPIVLLLAGYLVGLRARAPRVADGVLAILLGVGLWQSVATADVTRGSFADRRAVCHFLQTLPPKPVWSDFQIATWCGILDMNGWTFRSDLHSFDAKIRRDEIARIQSGYLVTGGGREPWYGCIDCIPQAAELDPSQWRLVKEFPGPRRPTVWRTEPARIWERIERPAG